MSELGFLAICLTNHKPQTKGTVLSVCICQKANQKNRPFGLHNHDNMLKISRLTRTRIIASLPCEIVLGDLTLPSSKKSFYHQGFFAVNGERFLSLGQCGEPS